MNLARHTSATDLPRLELPTFFFCRSRKCVEGVARELAATLGWHRVGANHAVLVATCAYGMALTGATFSALPRRQDYFEVVDTDSLGRTQ